MIDVKKEYGIDPMTFEEEINFWKTNPNKAMTRNNKVRLHKAFQQMKELAEYMEGYCKCIPEEDDEHHAQLVKNLTERMESLYRKLDEDIFNAIYHPQK